MLMLILFPFLMAWINYMILKNDKYEGPEPGEEEFGYKDLEKRRVGRYFRIYHIFRKAGSDWHEFRTSYIHEKHYWVGKEDQT